VAGDSELRALIIVVLSSIAVVTLLEYNASTPFSQTVRNVAFQTSSIVSTTGFMTADYTRWCPPAQVVILLLFFIGGCSGSTAGGMKTTTIAVLILNANGTFRHRDEASAFSRRISDQTVKIAATIFALYLTLFTVSSMIISLVESLPLLTCMFEAASAIGTVGLTLGITPKLGLISRGILIFLMYFGRVGGLTLIYAAVPSRRMRNQRLPLENIAVG
jgi:trk system potassium uptake protein TrkH